MTATSYLRPAVTNPGPQPGTHRTRRRVLIAAVSVLVIVIATVWLIAFSSVFGVRTVNVRVDGAGAGSVTAAQIRAAAHVPRGSPLVRLDTAAIALRVRALPAIATAQVSTSMPSTVTITVTERTAVGYTQDGDHVVLIDRSGTQYRSVDAAPAHLPHFVLPGGAAARPTGAALATVAASLPASLRAQVITVQALNPDAITLSLHGGVTVQWGDASGSEEKSRILRVLLPKHPSLVDVSDPGQPFTR